AVDQSPEILEKVRTFWRERLDAGAAVIEWGIDRGELPPVNDVDLVIEGLLAPIYLRVLLSGQSVTADFLKQLIELLLDGALHRVASRRPASEAQSPGLPGNARPVLATVEFAPHVASDDQRGTSRISAALTQLKRQSEHAS